MKIYKFVILFVVSITSVVFYCLFLYLHYFSIYSIHYYYTLLILIYSHHHTILFLCYFHLLSSSSCSPVFCCLCSYAIEANILRIRFISICSHRQATSTFVISALNFYLCYQSSLLGPMQL